MKDAGTVFEKDKRLVEVRRDAYDKAYCMPLNMNNVIRLAHEHCQPVKWNADGKEVPVTLPDPVAKAYLDLGQWGVPPLAGITTAPLLRADGTIICKTGYDAATQVYCDKPPEIAVPDER
jgi:hypothetical protein